MNLLTKQDGELKEAKKELSEIIRVLTTTSNKELIRRGVVRESYQTTEATLDEVARGLKQATQESLSAVYAELCPEVLSAHFTVSRGKPQRSTRMWKRSSTSGRKSETQRFSGEQAFFTKSTTQGSN